MIAAGDARRPSVGTAPGTGEQVVGAQLIESADADAQFERDGFGRETAGAGLGKEMTEQRRSNTVGELEFFMARKMAGRWI